MPSKKDELSQRDSNQIASGVTGAVHKPISKRSTGTGPSCMSSVTGQGMRHVSTAISHAALVVRLMRAKSWLRSFALRFYALNLG